MERAPRRRVLAQAEARVEEPGPRAGISGHHAPQDHDVELEPFCLRDREHTRRSKHSLQAFPDLGRARDHRAAGSEASDGVGERALVAQHKNRRGAGHLGLLRLVAFAAAGPVPLEREHLVGQLDDATHTAEVAREGHEVRDRAATIEESVADARAHLGPPEAAGVDHLLRVTRQEQPTERAPRHQTEQQLHLDLREVLGLIADQMVIEPTGGDGGKGDPAEVDLVQAAAGLEMVLPATGHLMEPAPLPDERRSALATEGFVLLARK